MPSAIMTTSIVVGRGSGIMLSPAASAPSSPSALVAGAGTAAANGTYTPRGTNAGKSYYNLVGQPDDFSSSSIYWDGTQWNITFSDASTGYSSDPVDFPNPWDAIAWLTIDGAEPVPTVTQA
jgi:hypothetical protein